MVTQQLAPQHRTGRLARRASGVVVAAALCLVVAPGVASAKPVNPSDQQISQAQATQTAAEQAVGAITAELATAQSAVADAQARSAIALDVFEGKQADYDAAHTAADAAAAAARQADDELAGARADLAGFARESYMQGSTDPSLVALTTADGPAQMLERAALLDAAGAHRSDVVDQTTTAQQQATAADAAARTALQQAADLQQQAQQALATANALETSARQQAADLATRTTALQQQLDAARTAVLGLEGARQAALEYDRAQAAAQAAAEAAAQRAAQQAAQQSRPSSSSTRAVVATTTAGQASGSAVETAIAAAKRYIGTIYAWGGGSLSGPSEGWGIDDGVVGFDCSGLTRYAYAQAGISIPRNSIAQYRALPKVARADLQRGDLVFYALDTSDPGTIHHVAMYLGGGQMIEAPQSGQRIHITAMRWGGYIGAVRPSA